MTIQELIDQFEIQGAYCIKEWDWEAEDYIVLAEGHDFECEKWNIDSGILNSRVSYMYAVDGVLNIEVE